MSMATIGTNDYPCVNWTPDAPDPWGFSARECTSFVAWRLNNNLGINFANAWHGQWFGNADHWADAARAAGVPVDGNPSVGSVAAFPPGVQGAGKLGHVAFVIGVGNGTVTVEDCNYRDLYDKNTGYNYSQHTVNCAGLIFIHFTASPPASGQAYQVTGANSNGLANFSEPRVNSRFLGWKPNGTTLYVVGQSNHGDQSDGRTQYGRPFTTWDQLADGTWVYDWYMNTPVVATTGYSPGINPCSGG
ncbi:MAG: CHAP domain-containing protein [Pseudonocardiaceae bacterium]